MQEYTSPSERLKALTDQLEQGVSDIFQSGQYAAYLTAMSKFHHYSFRNTILIFLQNPNASHVAGFHAWKKDFGRSVKAGEHGIQILAPCPKRKWMDHDKIDPATGLPVKDENGNTMQERTIITIPRYRVVTVFDVSQTEGKELPSLGVAELYGDVPAEMYLDRPLNIPSGMSELEVGQKMAELAALFCEAGGKEGRYD